MIGHRSRTWRKRGVGGRPPATAPPPNPEAAFMRAYRAFRAGRGPNPGGRAAFLAKWENELTALEDRRRLEDAEMAWAWVRGRVFSVASGIRVEHPYRPEDIPQPLRRSNGVPLDEIAARLDIYDASELLRDIQNAWELVSLRRATRGRNVA